ncbi:hypothetical protein AKJ09_04056 [Labilithrix luteola]|uniref:Uncharacterized protein n=1 Tax=Labilithrix luteola TaxID=1391654 RepID=A0A0K1PV40_9BACT|nr:hypothetical protein AKJ09_04056 [Labilithrix luteola]
MAAVRVGDVAVEGPSQRACRLVSRVRFTSAHVLRAPGF